MRFELNLGMRNWCAIDSISKGFPVVPTVERMSQWKDRKKEIEMPLFSEYCFVRLGCTKRRQSSKPLG
jgi:hypothetical protein